MTSSKPVRVVIVGPNLPDQSKGSFHVHAEGCADLTRSRNYRGQEAMELTASSQTEVCDFVYPPEDFDCQSGDYLDDFHFAPCVRFDR